MSDAVKEDRDNGAIYEFLDSKHRGKPSLERGRINTLVQRIFLFDFYNIAFLSSGRRVNARPIFLKFSSCHPGPVPEGSSPPPPHP